MFLKRESALSSPFTKQKDVHKQRKGHQALLAVILHHELTGKNNAMKLAGQHVCSCQQLLLPLGVSHGHVGTCRGNQSPDKEEAQQF